MGKVISLDGLIAKKYSHQNFKAELVPALEKFIIGITDAILNRQPSSSEIKKWINHMFSGSSRNDIALRVLCSDERRKLHINHYYQTYLKRIASDESLRFFLTLMSQGKKQEDILAAFLSSSEYVDQKGKTNEQYIRSLFEDVLLKQASETDINSLLGILNSHSATKLCVAHNLLCGQEYRKLFIQKGYQKILGRNPDRVTFRYWMEQFKNGLTQEEFLAGLLSTKEFFTLSNSKTTLPTSLPS